MNHVGAAPPFEKCRWSHVPIAFTAEELRPMEFPHIDAFVTEVNIQGMELRRVLIDGGSSADVIFLDCLRKMGYTVSDLQPSHTPLQGFGGNPVYVVGSIKLKVSFSGLGGDRTEDIVFDVVDMPYPYNALFDRRLINTFLAVLHHGYLCMKMPGPNGVILVYGNQVEA